jgi:hypothetical protein
MTVLLEPLVDELLSSLSLQFDFVEISLGTERSTSQLFSRNMMISHTLSGSAHTPIRASAHGL